MIRIIKEISERARENSMPCDIFEGKVINDNPLQVQINQRLILEKSQLIIPQRLTRHTVQLYVGNVPTNYEYRNQLKLNDELILISAQGGQKFLVVDRKGG